MGPCLRVSPLALVLLLICTAATAGAQISLYGTFSPAHVSSPSNGTYWSYGGGGGLTVSPFHVGPVSLGLDARGSIGRQTRGAETILVGPKLAINLPLIPFKPYVQASGGYLGLQTVITNGFAAGQTTRVGFWAYEVLAGIDYPLIPHMDLRLIEIGGGQGFYRGSPSSTEPNISFETINSGLVLHF